MNSREKPSNGLARAAYNAIKRDIIWCRVEPGQLVSKAQLIERYGFGEASVREALNRLSQEQLVTVIPREGYKIAPVTLKQVQDLFETRLVIEPAVARLAAGRVDEARLRALDDAHRQSFDVTDRDRLEAYVSANTAFHMEIASASRNERLAAVMSTLLDEMERVMLLSYVLGNRASAQEPTHGELVDALVAGEKERAAEIMTHQLQDNRKFVLDAFLMTPSLQTVNLAAAPGTFDSVLPSGRS